MAGKIDMVDDSHIAAVLDLLNFKVAQKEPGDKGYVYEHYRFPSEYQTVLYDNIRLREEMDNMKRYLVDREQYCIGVEARERNLASENKSLHARISAQMERSRESKIKLRQRQKEKIARHVKEMKAKDHDISILEKRNLELNAEVVDMFRQNVRLEEDFQNAKKENAMLANDLEEWSNKVKCLQSQLDTTETVLQEQNQTLRNYQAESEALKEVIRQMKESLSESDEINEGMGRELERQRQEKNTAVKQLLEIKRHLKVYNRDFDKELGKFVKTWKLQKMEKELLNSTFPTVDPKADEDVKCLANHLRRLNTLLVNTFEEFSTRFGILVEKEEDQQSFSGEDTLTTMDIKEDVDVKSDGDGEGDMEDGGDMENGGDGDMKGDDDVESDGDGNGDMEDDGDMESDGDGDADGGGGGGGDRGRDENMESDGDSDSDDDDDDDYENQNRRRHVSDDDDNEEDQDEEEDDEDADEDEDKKPKGEEDEVGNDDVTSSVPDPDPEANKKTEKAAEAAPGQWKLVQKPGSSLTICLHPCKINPLKRS